MVANDADFAVVGGVEFSREQLDALIGIMNLPGWGQLCRIFENDRDATSEDMLGKRVTRTLQDLGVAQGRYQTADAYLALAEVAASERANMTVRPK